MSDDSVGLKETIAWYDAHPEEYANSAYKVTPLDAIDSFLSRLPEHPRVLDAGCGPGRETGVFHNRGADVTGLDISEGLLKEARARNPGAHFVHGDLRNLPFADESFDGVWSYASLVHMDTAEDAQQAVREFYRVLKPGGALLLYVKAQLRLEKTEVVSHSLVSGDRFFRYYTADELQHLIETAGFTSEPIVLVEDVHQRDDVKWLQTMATKPG